MLAVVVPKARLMTGVAPPVDCTGYVPVTLVTVPWGSALQVTVPWALVVSALAPLQFAARPPVMAKVVVVALVNNELPVSVVEAMTAERLAFNCPPTFNTDEIVEEPVTARFVVVPLCSEKFPPVTRPVLEIVKRVEVAKEAVEEEIAKSVVGTTVLPVVDAAKSESIAYGEEVPIPRAPSCELNVKVVEPAEPKRTVLEAFNPLRSDRVVEVALVLTPKLLVGVNSNATLPAA